MSGKRPPWRVPYRWGLDAGLVWRLCRLGKAADSPRPVRASRSIAMATERSGASATGASLLRLVLCPGSSLEKSAPEDRQRGLPLRSRCDSRRVDSRWSETPMDARWSLPPGFPLSRERQGGGQDGGALHRMVQGGAGMTTMQDRALRLVVTPAEAGVQDVLPFPAQGRSHLAYAGLT